MTRKERMWFRRLSFVWHGGWWRWTHAWPDGRPVLLEQASWHTINGVVLFGRWLVLFRRNWVR